MTAVDVAIQELRDGRYSGAPQELIARVETIVAAFLQLQGGITPPAATTYKFLTAADVSPYVPPAGLKQLLVLEVGGGGGGGGAGAPAGTFVAGTAGGATSFAGIVANGGPGAAGALHGAASGNGAGAAIWRAPGAPGSDGTNGAVFPAGGRSGDGANSTRAGAGLAVSSSGAIVGQTAQANSGSGGGGGYNNAAANGAAGGSAGETVFFVINAPFAPNYPFAVGLGGNGGISTATGGAGANGCIILWEVYGP